MKAPLTLAEAQKIAEALMQELAPICDRAAVAGSVRRLKPAPKDLEIVAIPKPTKYQAVLTGLPEVVRWSTDDWCDAGLAAGRLRKRLDKNGRGAVGDRYKRLEVRVAAYCPEIEGVEWMALDLFLVHPPSDWWTLYVVRTGPGEYSHMIAGLARSRGFRINEGHLERLVLDDGKEAWETVPLQSEEEFFATLGLPYLRPEERT